MLTLYVYPFSLSILKSFISENGEITLKYYQEAIDSYFHDIIFSLEICLLSTFITTILSILLAIYLRLSESILKRFFNAVYRIPLFLPMVVVAQMSRTFLAPHGLLNIILAKLGLINIDAPLQFFDWKGLTFGFVWKQLPFMTLMILGGLKSIDDSFIEVARNLGAGIMRIITSIMLPMAKTIIAIAIILTFASNISTFTLPYMLIGGSFPTTITVDIAHRVTYFGDWGTANALGVFSYMMVIFIAIYYIKYVVGKGVYE
jgi:ABC-type spermidine/putrescine transport system permease subunit I